MIDAGLCDACKHMKRTETRRGGVFFLCQLALTDDTFHKYPLVPVMQCPGYRPQFLGDSDPSVVRIGSFVEEVGAMTLGIAVRRFVTDWQRIVAVAISDFGR